MIKSATQGAVQVFTLEGALNAEEADHLRDAIEAVPRSGRPQWVFDLAEVPLIDSVGCEALLDARDAAVSVGGAAHLAGVSPLCKDILAATGLERYFQIFEGTNQAIAQFAR
ncbi:MAG: STAS domain-containing protein [Planctomycetota bacterium]